MSEAGCGHDAARHRTALVDLRLDVIRTADLSIVPYCVLHVCGDGVANIPRRACPTCVEIIALLVLGLIVVAGLIDQPHVVRILPHTQIIAAIARPGTAAIDDLLHAEVGGGEGAAPLDVHTIGQGAGDTMRPAAAAVLRNVLVADGGEEVRSIDVPPVPGIRQAACLDGLPWEGLCDALTAPGVGPELLVDNQTMVVGIASPQLLECALHRQIGRAHV